MLRKKQIFTERANMPNLKEITDQGSRTGIVKYQDDFLQIDSTRLKIK